MTTVKIMSANLSKKCCVKSQRTHCMLKGEIEERNE